MTDDKVILYHWDGKPVTAAEYFRRLDAIPAVAPDNDPEDTIARFNDAQLPYPGYQARGPDWGGVGARANVEDQITDGDRRASRDIEIFLLGAVMGACWSALLALVFL